MEEKIYELTNPQKSIWLTEQYYDGTSINNICGSLLIKQKLNIELFNLAINKFIENNDSFRLRFKLVDGNPCQYVAENEFINFEIIDLKSESKIADIANEIVKIPFNFYESRLFNFKIFKLDNGFGGFIVNVHHIISDAATLSFVGTEIVDIYSKLLDNEPIPEKTFSYIDYIHSEKEYLGSSRFQKDKEYWRTLLSPVPDVATIPSFKNEVDSPESNRLEFSFDKNFLYKIISFCKKTGISVYNFLMAVYGIYIGRVNNMDTFIIGTPILNRTSFAEKHTSGMFISTSLLKINTEENLSFRQFSQNITKDCMQMLRHQKYNYQCIIDDLRKDDKNIANLYDILLSYQVTHATDTDSKVPYESTWHATPYIGNSMAIHFHDNNDSGNLLIEYDYKICKYDKVDIENMHARIVCMINQILENNEINIHDIEIVTEKEKNKILYEFNDTKADYPKDKTIVQLFEEQVEKTPDNIAVVFEDQKLTYRELNERANQLAWYLKDNDISKNDIISVCMNKNLEFIIAILGIQKAGAAYLPIHPDYPIERISYIFKNSKSKLLISNVDVNIDCIYFNKIPLNNCPIYNINIPAKSISPAYVIYTSGSTGAPKGVVVSHSNLINFIYSFNNSFNNKFSSDDNCLSLTNISFDVSVCELFTPLVFGSTLVLYDENTITNIPHLVEVIEKNEITFTYLPPNILLDIYNYISINSINFEINKMLVGVESIKNDTLNKYLKLNANIEILNGYGPTETTICATFFKYKFNNSIHDIVPIGKALCNNTVLVLDKHMKIQPFNAFGEIFISGDNVSSGYLYNELLTNTSFIKYKNTIFYKTGDIGYVDYKGNIHYIGRNDSQVKLNGYRIELGEVNNTIKKNKSVKNAYTLIKKVNNIDTLCSYIVANNSHISIDSIKKDLRLQLPYYMVPSHIVLINQLPLTLNGKIDKNKLPEITITTKDIVSPSNSIEQKLIIIWQKILNIENISIDDDFFDLGADSLCAIKLISEISINFNIEVNISNIFNNSKLSELAKFINTSLTKKSSVYVSRVKNRDYYPTSSAQKRIYYSSSIDRNGTLYNMPGSLILSNMPDIKKLENCFNKIISRHESLRTYFDVIDGEVVQKIKNKVNFKIKTSEDICSDKTSAYKDFVKPFDLSKAPLMRVKLLKLENEKALLLFDMHHIISDGTSMRIIIDELCNLYNNYPLQSLKITYKDYAVWEQENLLKNKFKDNEKYWLDQFKNDIPILNMPTNYPRPLVQSFEGANITKKLDSQTTKNIYQLSKKLKVTPYLLFLSCYYILLYKYTSNNDIIVGTPIVGRENAELNNIVGMFVNSLALRMQIGLDNTFEEFLDTVKSQCLKAFEHQIYPFNELVKKLDIKRDPSRNPLFDTMFIYQNEGNPKVFFNNIKSKYYLPDMRISKFDLSLEVTPNKKYFNLRFEYSTKLFDTEFIKYLSIHYINILKTVMQNINIKIEDIDMVTDVEKNKILYEFNNTQTNYPKDKTLATLFEEQVAINPNKKAIFFEGRTLTYKQLNEKANQLANYIINQKVKKEDIICLLFDKSLEMVISILAVIKAGCAFLPIDVYYPKDRIDFIIGDSKSKLLLTTSEFVNKSNDTIKAICIDLDDKNIYNDNFSNNLETTNISSDNLAYVMYTSGSTGNPKGVMIEQKSIIRLVKNTNFIKFRKNEKILQTGSIVFDACTFEIWGALLNGCELFLIKKDDLLNSSNLKEYLIKHKISILWLTAPLFNQLVENDNHIFDTVKYVLTGGDVLSPKHINIVRNSNPKLNIINGYGPTENTTFSCCFNIKRQYNDSIPIGYPISNSTCYIVSNNGILRPIGCPGELWVGGDGVGRGYLNNDLLSNEKFIKNPFANGKIYKTGDLAKWLPNGQVEFLGRIDSQVKIRGYRIEPDEINTKILNYPNIKECTTVIHIINDEKTICSYFVSDENVDTTNLKNYLKQYLPTYMIPTYFMQLKKLPLNTNGKIDKKLLPIDFKLKHSASNVTLPKNKHEELLLNIFKKVLNNTDIGTTDNFFDIGGDSLLAMKLKVEALSSNLIINYADIFQYPTVKDLAKSMNHVSSQQKYKELDFSKYNKILEKNCISHLKNIKYTKINNILLTGFTGFLGAHVLDSFIKQETGIVYCLIRGKNNMTAHERLLNVLHFYFNKKYDKYIGNRIQLVEGDITFHNLGLSDIDYENLGKNISTVIHCAALVKHFGSYNEFENINIFGTQKIIDLCTKFNLRLLHVSTISVSGNAFAEDSYVENNFTEDIDYNETNFYIGQNLHNLYIKSKFEAEKLVLDAINSGLEACILRMGNLTSRATEGKFQQNHFENSFVNRFKSILQIKYAPDYLLTGYVEFTPIDYCGDAIIKIANHFNKDFTIFHLLNDNHVNMIRLFDTLKDLNIDLKIVSSDEFVNIIDSLLKDENKKSYLEGIINDLNSEKKLVYESPVKIKSEFTKEYLRQIGFEWPYIDKKYIKNYLKYLADIGYFNIEIN